VQIELGEGLLYALDGTGGWVDIGRTDGVVLWELDPPAELAHLNTEEWRRLSDFTLRTEVPLTEAHRPILAMLFGEDSDELHGFDAAWHPRDHIRCHRCHPAANPRPLPINGHEYRRPPARP
jgi:hypothetical protein